MKPKPLLVRSLQHRLARRFRPDYALPLADHEDGGIPATRGSPGKRAARFAVWVQPDSPRANLFSEDSAHADDHGPCGVLAVIAS